MSMRWACSTFNQHSSIATFLLHLFWVPHVMLISSHYLLCCKEPKILVSCYNNKNKQLTSCLSLGSGCLSTRYRPIPMCISIPQHQRLHNSNSKRYLKNPKAFNLPHRWSCALRSSLSLSQIAQMEEFLDIWDHIQLEGCTSCSHR